MYLNAKVIFSKSKTYVRQSLFCDVTQHILVVMYRRFGTTYWFHLQGQPLGCPETPVPNYQYSLHNISERRPRLHLGGSLKSRNIGSIHSLVFSLEGRAWQEPEPSHVTGMALAHCILGKFLGVVFHCFPPHRLYTLVKILNQNFYILVFFDKLCYTCVQFLDFSCRVNRNRFSTLYTIMSF